MEQFDFTGSPLHLDAEGTIRVIGSRITLDTLVTSFKQGDTPEDIQDGFPSLSLAQINAVIAWYLAHTVEADEYLKEVDEEAEALRREIQSTPKYKEFSELIKQRINERREQLIKN
jgi:uncharacterized protein (DUF433 family)